MRDVCVTGLAVICCLSRALSLVALSQDHTVESGGSYSEIVYPERVNEKGISYSLDKHYRKRSIDAEWDQRTFYDIKAFGRTFHLDLQHTLDIVSPNFIVQRYSDNHTWLEEVSQGGLNCFYSGIVNGDAGGSRAALSLCDGLTGMFAVGKEKFVIEPQRLDNSSSELPPSDSIPHVIYSIKHNHQNIHNGTEPSCGTHKENYKHRRRKGGLLDSIEDLNSSVDSDSYQSEYSSSNLTHHHVHRRSVSVKNYVEVMVAADQKMAQYHGADLQHYILTLMSIVNSIYKNHTIGNFIHIVVVKIVIFNSDRDGPNITKNAELTLKRFCNWQYKNNVDDDSSPYHYDTAILLTRHDICRAPTKCDTLGLAELGTMCEPESSCAIVEDNGISAAYTIAHELGHVFGLPHDDDNKCRQISYRRYSNTTFVMSPTLDQHTDPWSWSECSRKLLTKYLSAGFGHCLEDVPTVKRYRRKLKKIQKKTSGQLYSGRRQCELVYGYGHTVCPYMISCKILWCAQRNNLGRGCRTQHMPMADGTECGTGRICMKGKCSKRSRERVRHGGWGPWRPFGHCTRTCGGGIKMSYRECNRPVPMNGGKYCVGKRIKYRHCNIQSCAQDADDFRLQQCAEYNSRIRHYKFGPGSQWIPAYDGIQEKEWCKLWCKSNTSNSQAYKLNSKVIDGTKCRPDGDDICVAGQCRKAGCDNKLGSNMKRDRCGVCGGDNASCRTFTGSYNSVREAGYNNVSIIPRGATNIDIRQTGYSNLQDDQNYLALVNSRGEYMLNGNYILSEFPTKIPVLGGVLEYSGCNAFEERINSTGIIYEEILVQVLISGHMNPPKVRYSYTLSLDEEHMHSSFVWVDSEEWTDCDNVCQGTRHRKVKCVREHDRVQVSDRRCENVPKPRTDSQRCNIHCTINWEVDRDECSVRCGIGTAKQWPYCVLQSHHNVTRVDNSLCVERRKEIGPRPSTRVRCKGLCLDAVWKYSDWSQCTATCGGGAQKRTGQCMDIRGNVLSKSECRASDLQLQRTCNTQPCPRWKTEDWTGCSVTCGRGSRHRRVLCLQGENEIANKLCDHAKKPLNKLECYLDPCPQWVTGEWGQCSVSCGKGVSERSVICQSNTGETMTNHHCDTTQRPYGSRPCNLGKCQTTPLPTTPPTTTVPPPVDWKTGSWTQCSASCGEGIKHRYVRCMDILGEVRDTRFCSHIPKPAETETCIQRACGYWQAGDWGKCSVTCGEGRQWRRVSCVTVDDEVVDNFQCDMDIQPDTDQTCNMGRCIPEKDFDIDVITTNDVVAIKHWTTGPWSGCSSTCGTGWQRRQVVCRDEMGTSTSCDETQKPPYRQECDAGPCPGWVHGEWSECSVSCGGNGIQKRVVLCHSGSGHSLPDNNCDIFERPPDSRMCNNGHCSTNRSWQVGPWSPCSATCGRGRSQREVLCVDVLGNTRPSAECKHKKPRNTKHCKMASCPHWHANGYSKCSVSCGVGVRLREVHCYMGLKRVDDSLCLGKKKPKTEKECNRKKCMENMWKVGNWSECSKTCGFGSKFRSVMCTDEKENVVDEELCDLETKPKTKRRCSEFPCPFMWNTSPWSECSASCGNGQQTRRVVCQAVTKEGWILPGEVPYGCRSNDKPNGTQACSYGMCNQKHHWVTGAWGECSTRCGEGRQRRHVICMDVAGQKRPKRNCPKENKPPGRQPCYSGPCYAKSCQQLKQQTSIRVDGSYKLYVHGRLIEVYCKHMRKKLPQEYISLSAGETENYSEIYPHRLKRSATCPNNGSRVDECDNCRQMNYRNAGNTSYSMIRIDIVSLKVMSHDKTYATTSSGKDIPYGTAGDCYSSQECPQGRFRINLSGTGLIVSPNTTWVSHGYHTAQNIERLQDGEIVSGLCGGLCGRCSPDMATGLLLDVLP